MSALAWLIIVFAPTVAVAERAPHFSGGFGDYYVGVLYRAGRYLDATALAKNLLDADWTRRELACVNTVLRANLVVQIHRRMGRKHPDPGVLRSGVLGAIVLGARVSALRQWVRGPEAAPSPMQLETAGIPPTIASRVMGWHRVRLAATDPVPLRATPATEYPARITIPVLRETTLKQVAQPAKSYEPPRLKPADVAPAEPEPAPEPVRKPKAAPRTATSSQSKKPAPPTQHLEPWMERVFVN